MTVGTALVAGLGGQTVRAAPQGGVFTVNSLADAVDDDVGDGECSTGAIPFTCTLRAAIQEASFNSNPNTINLPAGTYTLTLSGAAENAGVSGDLDITGTVTVIGAGPDLSIIDGNGELTVDRVLDVHGGSVSITGVSFRNGRGSGPGAGIYNREGAVLTLIHSEVRENVINELAGTDGGGIYSLGELDLQYSSVISNVTEHANANGGGISHGSFDPELRLSISDSTISGNRAGYFGGGLYLETALITVTNSTIDNNQAQSGGGIFAYDVQLTVVNSTLSGNSSMESGGGLVETFGSTRLLNATVTNNTGDSDADGSGSGGGVAEVSGLLSFQNSIIAGNFQLEPFGGGGVIEVEDDCTGFLTSGGDNIVYATGPGACTIAGTFTFAWPMLRPLAHNGGPTRTHNLLAVSPAIDAGDTFGCIDEAGGLLLRDQRGTPRPLIGADSLICDLGAVEFVRPLLLPLVGR